MKKIIFEPERSSLKILSNNYFSIGDYILHSEFGKGKILGVNGKKLQIKFENKSSIVNIFSDFVKKINAS